MLAIEDVWCKITDDMLMTVTCNNEHLHRSVAVYQVLHCFALFAEVIARSEARSDPLASSHICSS